MQHITKKYLVYCNNHQYDFRPPSRYRVDFIRETTAPLNSEDLPLWHHPTPFPAQLISNNRVTAPDHFQDVRLIRLDITGSDIRYEEFFASVVNNNIDPYCVKCFWLENDVCLYLMHIFKYLPEHFYHGSKHRTLSSLIWVHSFCNISYKR